MRCVFIIFIVISTTFNYSTCFQRKLDFTFNENCSEMCEKTNARLAHVTATGPNDVIHYLWDFTENPTVFVAVTSLQAKLDIKWNSYLSRQNNSLSFTEKPSYTIGISLEKLLEFNDVNDNGRIDIVNENYINELDFKNFQWSFQKSNNYNNLIEFCITASSYKDLEKNDTRNGTITFLMHGFGSTNHSSIVPNLLHSENATQMDIIIDALDTTKDFSSSRFAIEFLIVSENNANKTLSYKMKRKLDDEFTPGIFEIMELTTPNDLNKAGYLEWRPISYTHPVRDITNSTGIIFYPIKQATANDWFNKNNLLYKYYGENMLDNLTERIMVSFGEKGDGFYKATKHATWTFITGYGTPPNERFSNEAIVIISMCIAIPLLLLFILVIYLCKRNRTKKNESRIPSSILR